MKRILIVTVGVSLIAVVAAAIGFAQPAGTTGAARAEATLPPLPADIKSRNRFIIGVKCDVPPFGYIDVQGKNAGFDVEIGRLFARYAFGRAQRVSFVCAPTAQREPLITNGRVDLVISTFTYTADRDTRIDFSRAYWKGTGRLLVKNDGSVQKLADLAGKRVATTSGSVYDRWMKNCFKNTQVIVADTFTKPPGAGTAAAGDAARGPLPSQARRSRHRQRAERWRSSFRTRQSVALPSARQSPASLVSHSSVSARLGRRSAAKRATGGARRTPERSAPAVHQHARHP